MHIAVSAVSRSQDDDSGFGAGTAAAGLAAASGDGGMQSLVSERDSFGGDDGDGDSLSVATLGTMAVYDEYPDGDTYKGTILNGLRNGRGHYRSASGDTYHGDWEDGQMHGKGTYTTASGNVYRGKFRENRHDGYGVYQYASGARYEGDYVDDKMHGFGKYYYSNGNIYTGSFALNKKHGRGRLWYKATGTLYEGSWRDDKQHGVGRESFVGQDTPEEQLAQAIKGLPGTSGVLRAEGLPNPEVAVSESPDGIAGDLPIVFPTYAAFPADHSRISTAGTFAEENEKGDDDGTREGSAKQPLGDYSAFDPHEGGSAALVSKEGRATAEIETTENAHNFAVGMATSLSQPAEIASLTSLEGYDENSDFLGNYMVPDMHSDEASTRELPTAYSSSKYWNTVNKSSMSRSMTRSIDQNEIIPLDSYFDFHYVDGVEVRGKYDEAAAKVAAAAAVSEREKSEYRLTLFPDGSRPQERYQLWDNRSVVMVAAAAAVGTDRHNEDDDDDYDIVSDNASPITTAATGHDIVAEVKEGRALYACINRDMYIGEYEDDMRHGWGRYVRAHQSSVFEGQYQRDRRHGPGREVFADGTVLQGVWEAGVLTSATAKEAMSAAAATVTGNGNETGSGIVAVRLVGDVGTEKQRQRGTALHDWLLGKMLPRVEYSAHS